MVEIGFLGEEIGAEYVGDGTGHAQHEGAKGFAIEFFVLVARQLEHAERLFGLRRQRATNRRPAARAAKFGEEPGFPFIGIMRRRLAVRLGVHRPPQSPQCFGEAGGVFAQVEPHGAEAENLDGEA